MKASVIKMNSKGLVIETATMIEDRREYRLHLKLGNLSSVFEVCANRRYIYGERSKADGEIRLSYRCSLQFSDLNSEKRKLLKRFISFLDLQGVTYSEIRASIEYIEGDIAAGF